MDSPQSSDLPSEAAASNDEDISHNANVDISGEQAALFKGDAIGSTCYSERFVLKTLIKLSQIAVSDWNEEFENELCFLWDMTIEHDVVYFLMKHDFLKLAASLLQGPLQEPRFIEIIIGMLRNMCCVEDVRKYLSSPESLPCGITNLLVEFLSSSDTLTLIQLVRLLNSVAWDLVKQEDERNCSAQQHWLQRQMDTQLLCVKLSFILNSSTCDELLYGVLAILNTLCTYPPALCSDKDFSQYFATSDMVGSMLECWHQLFVTTDNMMDDDMGIDDDDMLMESNRNNDMSELFVTKQSFKAAKKWIAILASFAGHQKGRQALVFNGDQLSVIVNKLVRSPDEDEQYEEILADTVTVLEALLATHFTSDIINKLLRILFNFMGHYGDNIDAVPERLTLREVFENYFESALRDINKVKLNEALDMCDENLTQLFWSIIEKRDPELLAAWRASEIKSNDDERTI